MESDHTDWLSRVAAAYDRTVRDYIEGVDPLASVPRAFRETPELKALLDDAAHCNSGAPENREFLDPQSGMRFLDVGCAAGLVNSDIGSWPSEYYGVDISPALIEAMRAYAAQQQIPVGSLHVTDLSQLPFEDSFFDLAAAIGVLEYCPWDYVQRGLHELGRVLKPRARVVLDVPNLSSPHLATMLELERYLGRRCFVHPRDSIESLLQQLFEIEWVDEAHVMLKYFGQTTVGQ
jgi:SAM-dependent methyltransferase